jgi:microcystin-dependent protein
MDPFIGEIQMFAFSFAPKGWAFCSGQLLLISQNQALFSLLGTQYGGDGQTTFALPDLRGRSMVHFGQGPGLSNISQGQQSGTPTNTLLLANMPNHTHAVNVAVNTATGTTADVTKNLASSPNAFKDSAQSGSFLSGVTSGTTGQSQPFSVQNPFLGINHCIALQGIFPSRN